MPGHHTRTHDVTVTAERTSGDRDSWVTTGRAARELCRSHLDGFRGPPPAHGAPAHRRPTSHRTS
ncbi:hypothetical protein BU52_17060 [Streptomyces toyocaensis]|uniref:Uncharacterized protein n=1 Tax=Streptomyces toyocaensis TaxID=55952 RepID=A0A081XQK0_STRTO|nr:hypothetical protein BU52_17060 [Streptomyces toyocaensis]